MYIWFTVSCWATLGKELTVLYGAHSSDHTIVPGAAFIGSSGAAERSGQQHQALPAILVFAGVQLSTPRKATKLLCYEPLQPLLECLLWGMILSHPQTVAASAVATETFGKEAPWSQAKPVSMSISAPSSISCLIYSESPYSLRCQVC